MKTSVFLIEDEPGCRQMLLDVLAHNPMLRVVGQAPSMAEAKSHIDQQPSEVFLVNTSLSDGSGIDVMHYIQKCQPQAKILALSALGDEKHIFSSLHAGASGYLLKNQIASHLVESIVCLINGGGYLCAHASKVLIERMRHSLQAPHSHPLSRSPAVAPWPQSPTTGVTLTQKERLVLDHAQAGMPTKRMAETMGISIFTVNQHLRNIYQKLNARNRMQAVQSARQQGLI